MAEVKKPEQCPSCGGKTFAVIRYQGESYWQCQSKKPKDDNPQATCKYWSTKWRAA